MPVPLESASKRLLREACQSQNSSKEDFVADLAAKTCVPCRGGVPPLKGAELEKLSRELPDWKIVNEHHITRSFSFPDFREALAFVNRVGELAEEQGHHPDIFLAWGKAEVTIWTHKIDGLTESDFILGAKIDRLYPQKARKN
jgi:4a-hydroxytetrahydrobiopterin dehydratase